MHIPMLQSLPHGLQDTTAPRGPSGTRALAPVSVPLPMTIPNPCSVRSPRSLAALHVPDLHRRDVFTDNLSTKIHESLVDICSSPRAGLVVRRVSPRLADGEGARS